MSKRWRIKPNKNLRDNARLVVPLMMDDFLSYKGRVISHPRLKLDLHRMRLAGKTLRYAMEVFVPGFDAQFCSSLEELKQLLDTMGRIHDCDVNIPRLQAYLREVRLFNRTREDVQDRIPTSALTRFIHEQSSVRRNLFAEMTSTLQRWECDDFTATLLQSMISDNLVKE